MSHDRSPRNASPGAPDRLVRKTPAAVAAVYAIVSAGWIAWSDRLLVKVAGNYAHYQTFQTYKGWLFIAVTSVIIYMMLRSAWKSILTAYERSRESERRLHLALTAARGGAWELDLVDGHEMLAYVSPELTRQMGVRQGETVTMRQLLERTHPDDVEPLTALFQDVKAATGERLFDIRYRVLTKNGSYGWVHSRGNVVLGAGGRVERMIGVSLDVSRQMQAEERAERLLRYDPQTGLARAAKFLADLDEVLAGVCSDDVVGVVQMRLTDLDHLIGEAETREDARVVRLVGDRLQELAEAGMLAARIADDVFAVATPALPTPEAMQDMLAQAMARLSEQVEMDDRTVRLRFRAGGAAYPQDDDGARGLLRNAGHALDRKERGGENDIVWFTEALDAEFRMRNERLRDLANAVGNGEIECHFQPIVDLRSGATAGFEALARWRRPGEGLLPPDHFIPLAEEFGLISALGEEVLARACRAAAAWRAGTYVSVNVSPIQLDDPAFPATIARILGESGLTPRRLELEITENALPDDPAAAIARLEALRQLGVSIAMDDFGTGYSSLALLSRLPFTRLKIDRSFIAGYGRRHQSTTIVDMIIDLCRDLGLSITAEGVETAEQADMLAAKGVGLAQGFRFSRPVPNEQAAALVDCRWPVARCAAEPLQEVPRRRSAAER